MTAVPQVFSVARMEELNKHQSRRANYQDVLDAPEHMVAEAINGVLYTSPRPAAPHARACSELLIELGPPFGRGRGGPGGWWILFEPELHLGDEILVPDLAGWRCANMPEFPKDACFTLAPDWVCEVLSPSTRRIDLGAKRDIYAREGVPNLWLVDPDARSLEAFELRGGYSVLSGRRVENQSVSLPPFDAVSFPLGSLWVDSHRPRIPKRHPRIHDAVSAVA